MQLCEEAAKRRAIEPRRMEVALFQIRLRRGVADELRQVTLIGAHRVRRGVAVQPQVRDEVFEMMDHRPGDRSFGTA